MNPMPSSGWLVMQIGDGTAGSAVHGETLRERAEVALRTGSKVLMVLAVPGGDPDLLRALERTSQPVQLHEMADLARPGNGAPDPELSRRLGSLGCLHVAVDLTGSEQAGPGMAASLLAVRLLAREMQIWTDVPGVFSADPGFVDDARLLLQLSYSEAQEFAAMGNRFMHPSCFDLLRRAGIPVTLRDMARPDAGHTLIGPRSADTEGLVKGVVYREGVTLISMDTPAMWQQAGFLADAFAAFKRHGLSVDLVSTSESSVSVSLDPGGVGSLEACLAELAEICELRVTTGLVSVSLVGNAIRTILGRLSGALDLFHDRTIHMVTQAANDLNLTLVVDAGQAGRLVQKLHQKLIAPMADHRPEFGPSWAGLIRPPAAREIPWWQERAAELESVSGGDEALYVYHLPSVEAAARRLLALRAVDRVLYAVKANHHPAILKCLAELGVGFECVSPAEIRHVLARVPGASGADILYTPNFASRGDYLAGLEAGAQLTIDNLHPLEHWGDLFNGCEVFLRLDLEAGHGHHRKVITAGPGSKFGIPLDQVERARDLLTACGARITGLHAHTGSGVGEPEVWPQQLERFFTVLGDFPEVDVIDLGGGLAVSERRDQAPVDLVRLNELLLETLGERKLRLWLEPGRYLVSGAGVLLARVTQVKRKGERQYLGIGTGMNSLIRPALYGAYHDIVNLSRLGESATERYTVVGPICETGDVLGESRFLPHSEEGDLILVANCGAYGRVMSSNYNLREPAREIVLDA